MALTKQQRELIKGKFNYTDEEIDRIEQRRIEKLEEQRKQEQERKQKLMITHKHLMKDCKNCGLKIYESLWDNKWVYCSKKCYYEQYRIRRKVSDKKYRSENRDKIREQQREYESRPENKLRRKDIASRWLSKPEAQEHLKKYRKEYYKRNKERLLAQMKATRLKKKEAENTTNKETSV